MQAYRKVNQVSSVPAMLYNIDLEENVLAKIQAQQKGFVSAMQPVKGHSETDNNDYSVGSVTAKLVDQMNENQSVE